MSAVALRNTVAPAIASRRIFLPAFPSTSQTPSPICSVFVSTVILNLSSSRSFSTNRPDSQTSTALSTITTTPFFSFWYCRPSTSSLPLPAFPTSPFNPKRYLSTQIRTAIDSAIATAPVVLFMKGTPETPQCGFSRTSIQILATQGLNPAKFTAFNVLEDEQLRAGIKEYSDWPTVPQLYVDGEFVGGCDILMTMHKDGSLAKMLDEKGVLVKEEQEGQKGGDRPQK